MTTDLMIRGGSLVGGPTVDVAVDAGKISAVVPAGEGGSASRSIDAAGLTLLPGAIDAHVHFDAPGRDEWEGWTSGSLAAAAGGVTTVVDMPIDSDPPTLDTTAVRDKQDVAHAQSIVDFALWGGLTPQNTDRVEALLGSGVVGLKAFLCESGWDSFAPCDATSLGRGMAAAARAGRPVAVHCEDPAQFLSPRDRPVSSEVAAVALAGATAAAQGARLHVVHCSSADAALEAKLWPGTSVETCPHYLTLDDSDAARIGPDAWCCPPLRDATQRTRLVEAVHQGVIDCVASDHSPCPPAMKHGDAPFAGIAGVQTALSVLLAVEGLEMATAVRLRTAAARLLGLTSKGAVAPGFDADIVLFDPAATWTVRPETLLTRHRRSPFMGMTMGGVVVATLVRGTVVYEGGRAAAPPLGRFVAPAASAP
ncbi:MAG TPA: allantoinase AllB [Acidimicrobiales bacterium]|nr:allantoinase AllB [Acidimicrobiales bacterium]